MSGTPQGWGAMTGPQHGTIPVPGTLRRSDHGAVRLGRRDIDGLILCAEQHGAPYDLLGSALSVQPAGCAASRPGGGGPGWPPPRGWAPARPGAGSPRPA